MKTALYIHLLAYQLIICLKFNTILIYFGKCFLNPWTQNYYILKELEVQEFVYKGDREDKDNC